MPRTKSAPRPDKTPSFDEGRLPQARPARAKGITVRRMSEQLKTALEAMAHEGLSLPLAATRAKMNILSLKAAFRKNHVKQAYNHLIADIRNNAGQSAYLRINHLSQTAESETVRLESNKWVAGVDNIAPIKRVEGRISHTHAFAGFAFGEDEAVDVTPPDLPSDGEGE